MTSAKKITVLIVDDDQALRGTLKLIFESLNCEVLVAEDGLKALDVIDKNKVSMVISDVRMPNMDGVSLLGAIEAKGLDLPVIIMTGFSDTTPEKIDEMNGVVLLEKPFSKKQLKEILDRFLLTVP